MSVSDRIDLGEMRAPEIARGSANPGAIADKARRVTLFSVVIAAGIVALVAARGESARAVVAQLRHLPPIVLTVALVLIVTQVVLQGLRLWAVVPSALALGVGRVAHAFVLGEWVNIVAPARTGDAMKIVLIRRAMDIGPAGLPSAAGVILADKLVDFASLVLLCAAGGLTGLLWTRAQAGLSVAILAVAVVLLLAAWLRLTGRWFREGRWGWVRDLFIGLSALRNPTRGIGGLLFSVGAWFAEGAALWILCVGTGVTLTFPQILVALVVLNVGISIPISFANIGVYEATLTAGLRYAGIPLPSALAVAVSHHGLELLVVNVGAIAALSLDRIGRPLSRPRGT
jgi:glycosyltransferase 2 family protein